jgi:hypothetical protein
MDNLIQVLVFLFIVYTIFGSAFKKKNTGQKKLPPIDLEDGSKESSSSSQYKSQDILEDLFGVKFPKTGNEYPPLPQKSEDEQYNVQYSDVESIKPERINLENQPGRIQDIDYDKLASLENVQSQKIISESKVDYSLITIQNKKLTALKNKIKNPYNFRELYLISEIISKPKALRK